MREDWHSLKFGLQSSRNQRCSGGRMCTKRKGFTWRAVGVSAGRIQPECLSLHFGKLQWKGTEMLSKSTEKQRESFTVKHILLCTGLRACSMCMHAMCTSISIHTSLISTVILNSFSLVYGTYFYQSFFLVLKKMYNSLKSRQSKWCSEWHFLKNTIIHWSWI